MWRQRSLPSKLAGKCLAHKEVGCGVRGVRKRNVGGGRERGGEKSVGRGKN